MATRLFIFWLFAGIVLATLVNVDTIARAAQSAAAVDLSFQAASEWARGVRP